MPLIMTNATTTITHFNGKIPSNDTHHGVGGIDTSYSLPSNWPLLMNGSHDSSMNFGSKYWPCTPAWNRSLTRTAPKPCVPEAPYPQLHDWASTGQMSDFPHSLITLSSSNRPWYCSHGKSWGRTEPQRMSRWIC